MVNGLTAYASAPFDVTFPGGTIRAGSFAPKVDFLTSLVPRNVAIGDLDGDGKPDLAYNMGVLRNTSLLGKLTGSSFASEVDLLPIPPGTYSYAVLHGRPGWRRKA